MKPWMIALLAVMLTAGGVYYFTTEPRAQTPDSRCTDACLHLGNQLQATLNKTTNPIQLASGNHCITDTLKLDHRVAPIIQGKGMVRSSREPGNGTTLLWCGPSDRFAMRMLNTREAVLRDLTFEVGYGTPLLGAIDSITDHRAEGYTVPPYANTFDRVAIMSRYGNPITPVTYGIRHRKGLDRGQVVEYPLQAKYLDADGLANTDANDWNNSETTFREVNVMSPKFPFYTDPKNSQAKAFRFQHAFISCDGTAESAGFGGRPDGTPGTSGVSSVDVRGGNVNKCGWIGDFGGPNDYMTFENLNGEMDGGILRTNRMWASGNATIRDSRFGLGNSPLLKEGACVIEYGWQGGLKIEGTLIDVSWRDIKLCMNSSPHGSGLVVENSNLRTKSSTPWKNLDIQYPLWVLLRISTVGGAAPYGAFFVDTQTRVQ